MRRSAGDERGFTLIEVITAMALSIFVLGITVSAFVSLLGQDRIVSEHNDAQDRVRITVDRLARDLRNLASPRDLMKVVENRPRAIERAGPFALDVRTVDDRPIPAGSANVTNMMRVRWCLNSDNPQNGVLWKQEQRWTTATPPAAPTASSCPAPGWDTAVLAADRIVNTKSTARSLFSYDSTNLEKITRIRTDVWVDPTPTRAPREVRVSSGVVLRNQNQFPVAAFTITATGGSTATGTPVRFDGSASVDPEGQPLRYCWFVNPPTPTPACADQLAPGATPNASFKGQGVVLSWTMPPGSHRVVLIVEDPAGLFDDEEKAWP